MPPVSEALMPTVPITPSPQRAPADSIVQSHRLMHQHTKRQMDLATRSSRGAPADQGVSSMGCTDSVDNLQQ